MPKATFENLPSDKQRHIKDTALEIFNEKGYARVTVRDIVHRAKISRGSFYQYFEGKGDLFRTIVADAQRIKLAYLRPTLAKLEGRPFLEALVEVFEDALSYLRDYPEHATLGHLLYHSSEVELLPLVKELDAQGILTPLHYLRRDKEAGRLREAVDIETAARIIYNLLGRELMQGVVEGRSDDELRKLATTYVDILSYGLQKRNADGEGV